MEHIWNNHRRSRGRGRAERNRNGECDGRCVGKLHVPEPDKRELYRYAIEARTDVQPGKCGGHSKRCECHWRKLFVNSRTDMEYLRDYYGRSGRGGCAEWSGDRECYGRWIWQ